MASSNSTDRVKEKLAALASEAGQHAVVVRVKGDGEHTVPSPEAMKQLATDLVDRVAGLAGQGASRLNVLEHLGSFVVRAAPAFLLKMLDQPEVAGAMLQGQGESPVEPIRPVRIGPATESGWVELKD